MDTPDSPSGSSVKERLYVPGDDTPPRSASPDPFTDLKLQFDRLNLPYLRSHLDRLNLADIQSRARNVRFNARLCGIFSVASLVVIILVNLALNLHPSKVQIDGVTYDRGTWLDFPDRVVRFEKPSNFSIVAVVLYTGKDRASVLDCYLKRNLVHSGGFLDEVIFVPETGKETSESLSWLNQTVSNTQGYSVAPSANAHLSSHYEHLWDVCKPGTLYIQISDEIVFFEDSTIPSLVKTKLDNPDSFLVSANVINTPSTSWIHHQLGVVKPYLPELKPPVRETTLPPRFDYWRASDLPPWDGPKGFKVPEDFKPPFRGHRWLPTNETTVDNTVALNSEYAFNGPGRFSWTIGAQHHYSFLEHLEKDELWRYKFPLWDHQFERMAITFICIWGQDITANGPIPKGGDHFLSVELPRNTKRHALIDGKGVAANFGFKQQLQGMLATDLQDRYRAYAEEEVCSR